MPYTPPEGDSLEFIFGKDGAFSYEGTVSFCFGDTAPHLEGGEYLTPTKDAVFLRFDSGSYTPPDAHSIVLNLDRATSPTTIEEHGDIFAILDPVGGEFIARFSYGVLESNLEGAIVSFIGIFASGDLSCLSAPVSALFSGIVPIAIDGNFSATSAAVVATNFKGSTNTGTLSKLLANCFSNISGKISPPIEVTFVVTMSPVVGVVTAKIEPPREGTISKILNTVVGAFSGTHIFPRTGTLALSGFTLTSQIYAKSDLAGSFKTKISIEYRYYGYNDIDLDNDFIGAFSQNPLLYIPQPYEGVVGNIILGYSYPNSVSLSTSSVVGSFVGVAAISGSLYSNYGEYEFLSTNINLEEGYSWNENDFQFRVQSGLSSSINGVVLTTVNKLVGYLDNISSDIQALEAVVGKIDSPSKPIGYALEISSADITSNLPSFNFSLPTIEDVSSNIQASHLNYPWGRLSKTLDSVSFSYGVEFQAFLKTVLGSNVQNSFNLNLTNDYVFYSGCEFNWQNDSLGLTASILLQRSLPVEGSVAAQLKSPVYSNTSLIHNTGLLKNECYFLSTFYDLNLENSVFDSLEELDFNLTSSELDLTSDIRIQVIQPLYVDIVPALQSISVLISGKGHVIGLIGGEYKTPSSYDIDIDFFYVLPNSLNLEWSFTKPFEDVTGYFRGGTLSGSLVTSTANILPSFSGTFPVWIEGTFSKELTSLSRNIVGKVYIAGNLSATLASTVSNIRLTTWINVNGILDSSNLGSGLHGNIVAILSIRGSISKILGPVSPVFLAQTPSHSYGGLSSNLASCVFFNYDHSRRITFTPTLATVVGNLRALITTSGAIVGGMSSISSVIRGRVLLEGTLNTSLENLTSHVTAVTIVEIEGAWSRTFSDVVGIFLGRGSTFGYMDIQLTDYPLASEIFMYSEVVGNLSVSTQSISGGFLAKTIQEILVSVNGKLASAISAISGKLESKGSFFSNLENVVSYFRGSGNTGIISSNLSFTTEIFIRTPLPGILSGNLQDSWCSIVAFQPRPRFAIIDAQTLSPIMYMRVTMPILGNMTVTTAKVTPLVAAVTYYGDMQGFLYPGLIPYIQLKSGPPLASTITAVTDSVVVKIKGKVLLDFSFDIRTSDVLLRGEGKTAISVYGGFVATLKKSTMEILGHTSQLRLGIFAGNTGSCKLSMKLLVVLQGSAKATLDDAKVSITLRTPIRITGMSHPVLWNAYGNILLVVPTLGQINASTSSIKSGFSLRFSSGTFKKTLDSIISGIRLMTVTNTKCSISFTTKDVYGPFRGGVDIAGTVVGSLAPVTGYFQTYAVPQPREIGGYLNFTTGSFSLQIRLDNPIRRLSMDLTFDAVNCVARGYSQVRGILTVGLGTLNTPVADIWLETIGASVRMNPILSGISTRFRGYSLITGQFWPTLGGIKLHTDFQVSTHFTGRLDANLGDAGDNQKPFPVLRVAFLGETVRNTYGRMEVSLATIPWYWVHIEGIVPWKTLMLFEVATKGVSTNITMYVPPGGRLESVTESVSPIILSLDIYGSVSISIEDKDLKSNIKILNACQIALDIHPTLPSVTTNIRGVSKIYGGISSYSLNLYRADIHAELGVTGYIIGGDRHPGEDRADEFRELGLPWPLPQESSAPWIRAYFTLQSISANIRLHTPLAAPFGTLTMRQMGQLVYGGSTETPLRTDIYLRTTKIGGVININPEKDDPELEVVSRLESGFKGQIALIIQGPMNLVTKGVLKTHIQVHHSPTGETVLYQKLGPVDCRFYGHAALRGYISPDVVLNVFSNIKLNTWEDTKISMPLITDKILSRIFVSVREYKYGALFNWPFLNMSGSFTGNVQVFGGMNVVTSNLGSSINLEYLGTIGSFRAYLSSLRIHINAHKGPPEFFSGVIFKNLFPIQPSIQGSVSQFARMVFTTSSIIPNISAHRAEPLRATMGDNVLKNVTSNMQGFVRVDGTLDSNISEILSDFVANFIPPIDGTLIGVLENAVYTSTGYIPVRGDLVAVTQDFRIGFFTINGWYGEVGSDLENGLTSTILLKLYSKSSSLPLAMSTEISGNVDYGYDRTVGSTIRVYDDLTDESLQETILLDDVVVYTFSDISEGEYYVLGTAKNSRVKSEIFDEICVLTD